MRGDVCTNMKLEISKKFLSFVHELTIHNLNSNTMTYFFTANLTRAVASLTSTYKRK